MKRLLRALSLTVLILLLMVGLSHASGPITLTDGYSTRLLGYMEILNDNSEKWTIEDVANGPATTLFKPADSDNLGHIIATNWLRFTVSNGGNYTLPFYLELAYPRIDSIELYTPNKINGYKLEKLERLKPFETRQVQHRYFVFSESINGGNTTTYYMRLHSSGIGAMNFPLTLFTESAFFEKVNNETLLFGLFFGILILIAIYNLFLYIYLKNNNFLFFVIYVICYIIAQAFDSGFAFQYLWPHSVFMEESFIYIIMCVLFVSLYSFTTRFLATKKTTPIFHKLLTVIMILTSLSAFLVFLLTTLHLPNTDIFASKANNVYNFLFRFGFTLSLLATGILCLLKGKKEARFYVLAWTGMYIAVLLGGLRYFAFMNQNVITANANQFGSVLLIFFLSLSLSDQLRIIQKQKDLMYKEIQSSNEKISSLNVTLEQTIQTRTASIKNLLDHADQGFLYFGNDLLVSKEYSSICKDIFGEDISSKVFLDLLPLKKNAKNTTKELLTQLFYVDSPSHEELISQLPHELLINKRNIQLHYKFLPSPSKVGVIMVILSDVSATYKLEAEIANKNRELEHIVRFLIHNNYFLQCVRSFIHFSEGLSLDLDKNDVRLKLHTFQENFRFFEMEDFVLKLQMLEQVLTSQELKEDEGDLLLSWIFEAIQQLEMTLGAGFFTYEEVISLEIDKIKEIEEKTMNMLSPNSPLLQVIKQLRFKPFSALLASYPAYVEKLAERIEKCINPINIEADTLLVNTEYYGSFAKSLIHVFRNCISHGIEVPDDRVALNKPEFGQISCTIAYQNEQIVLTISDDGQGIQRELIKIKAVEKGLLSEEMLLTITDEALLNLIFSPNFSTVELTSELSGRGVGLAAVAQEVTKLKGSYRVESTALLGTRFIFELPFVEATI